MEKIPIRHIKTTQKEPELSEAFSIRDVQGILAGKDMVQELHRHDFFLIMVLEKGTGNHEIDFISYPVRNYSVFFMRPGQAHQLKLKAESTGYLLQFHKDFYFANDKASRQLLRNAGNKSLCQLDAKRVKKLLVILDYILEEYSGKQEGYQDIVKANLTIFFIELVRNRQNSKSPLSKSTLYPQQRTEELLELLETNISTHKQASQYADMLNLSSYQLNAITKLTLDKTCSELINEHILLEAKRYLLATPNQVNQIAYQLGYEDVSYFIRFFKKHTGYSPEAFRLNFR